MALPGDSLTRAPHFRRVSEHVAAEIVRYIDERSLEPGDRIGTEDQLAKEFGVSRPTLREALRMLATGNLVRATKGPGGGIFVANTVEQGMGRSISDFIAIMLETNRVSIDELLDARALLEVPVAGLAAQRAGPEALVELRSAIEEARENLEDDSAQTRSDARVHHAVAAAAGNRVVEAFMEWTFDILQPSLRDITRDAIVESEIVEQHAAILSAIERGDALRAERAMRDHLRYVRDVVRAVSGDSEPAALAVPSVRAVDEDDGR